MNVRDMAIGDIVPYSNNPRVNDRAVDQVAESIRQFGFQQPIVVDRDNVVIVGHTRLKAAQKLGMEKVPVVVADELTEDEARAYRIVDNKTNEAALWDVEKLAIELGEIELGMGDWFTDTELAGLTQEEHEVEEVDVPEDAPARCKRGDVWLLGEHRLMCGDSSDPGDVHVLAAGGGFSQDGVHRPAIRGSDRRQEQDARIRPDFWTDNREHRGGHAFHR